MDTIHDEMGDLQMTSPAPPEYGQVGYLQQLLDRSQAELAEYKRGFVDEIRMPVLMELITLAHTVETFLSNDDERLTADDYRSFIRYGVLGDMQQALNRYGIEPFVCSTQGVNRRCQKVERVEETEDSGIAGRVQPLTRGYVLDDRILQKEHVILYRSRDGR